MLDHSWSDELALLRSKERLFGKFMETSRMANPEDKEIMIKYGFWKMVV